MNLDISATAEHIRELYKANPANAAVAIENYLAQEMQAYDTTTKLQAIEHLSNQFAPAQRGHSTTDFQADEQFMRFCSILLGRPVKTKDLQGGELQKQLTESLTVLFETLNKLIMTINLTLQSNSHPQETIRFLIGQQIDKKLDAIPLKEHLEQIHSSFLTSHRAFKAAMRITVEKILTELDPEALQEKEGGLGFNPLRKMDSLKRYAKVYNDCRQWFESGRCMEEFLRTFEKQCATMTNSPKEVLP